MKASEQTGGEGRDRAHAQQAGGKVAAGRAGVERIVMAIGQAVERHRRRAGGRHAEEDAQPVLSAAVPAVRAMSRQRGPEQRERQGKQRVAEPDQVEVLANRGNGHGAHRNETLRSLNRSRSFASTRLPGLHVETSPRPVSQRRASRATTPRSRNGQTNRRKTDSRRRGMVEQPSHAARDVIDIGRHPRGGVVEDRMRLLVGRHQRAEGVHELGLDRARLDQADA